MHIYAKKISVETGIRPEQIDATLALLEEGATVPFIARYRKEVTGTLDEVAITTIRDRALQIKELDDRKEAVIKSMTQGNHLTPELEEKIRKADTLAEVEDIYLPYKPKRKTKASVAREKGLQPLADAIMEQKGIDPHEIAKAFINPETVPEIEDAIEGALHIIAEIISENAEARAELRRLFLEKGTVSSKVIPGKEEEGAKYRDYFDWSEPVATSPSHRILAMRRAEKEEFISLTIAPPEDEALILLEKRFVTEKGKDSALVREAIHDGYKRLLSRSMETEIRLATKEKADSEAIRVFAENLRQLLMSSPLGQKKVMGIDPGFRTGCKVVCLDSQGKLLSNFNIYPHASDAQRTQSANAVTAMIKEFGIEAVAIGNGTAGRETESFCREVIGSKIPIIMVNESGASIYSASDVAREEFPDQDITVRGSVSIARRLMDPLAELVKIDPKSIGVGQYQHDVDQSALKQSLDDVVISCVNKVGVEVNTASSQLLSYVSGLGPSLAKNIVNFRNENGPFKARETLKKVPRLGPKAFEQAAGFLRVRGGKNPLDESAVHPESYHIVMKMAEDLGCGLSDLMKNDEIRSKIQIKNYVTDKIGLPTLTDIMSELAKPGRDPRESFETFAFSEDVHKMSDLVPGMKLPGIVTNITAFGVFVDIGVHQDGLVHISELADKFVKNPADVVKVHQKVKVTVMEVDEKRKRISLSMKSAPEMPDNSAAREQKTESKHIQKGKPAPKKDAKNDNSKNTPFNNPFADLLKKG